MDLSDASADKEPSAEPAKKKITNEAAVVRLFVWVGGIALALAGIFFVNYARKMGYLRPEFRLSMGAIFGLALVFAGQWLHKRSAGVAQAAVAAGIAVLMGVLLAGIHLEQMIPPAVGFVLLAITAGAAVVLSLRHGMFVALLGLIGGFATPALVGSNSHNPGALFGYLLVIQIGLIVVSRMRDWWWITLLTLAGGFIWSLVWILFFWKEGDALWIGLFLMGSTLAFILGGSSWESGSEVSEDKLQSMTRQVLRWLAMLVGVGMTCAVVAKSGFKGNDWIYVGIMAAGSLALGRLDNRQITVTWMSVLLCLGTLLSWHLSGVDHTDRTLYFTVTVGLGLLFAAGGYGCMWGARQPELWACLSVVGALGSLLLGYAQSPQPAWDYMWGTICLLLGAIYAVGAAPLAIRRDAGDTAQDWPLAVLAVGVIAFLSLAAPIELERQWITVAWAIMIPAVTWVQSRLKVSPLGWVSLILALGVAIRLLLNPSILDYPIGQTILLNWYLYGYGIPVLALLLAAVMYRRMDCPIWHYILASLSLVLFTALTMLEIRHGFLGADRMALHYNPSLYEIATYAIALLLLAAGLLAYHRRAPHPVALMGGLTHIVLGCFVLLIGLGLVENPLWNKHQVGDWFVFNGLLYVYGLPLSLLGILAWQLKRLRWNVWATVLAVILLVVLFTLVSLEVRQGFHGGRLDLGVMNDMERYSYSLAWVILGVVLLIAGIVTRNWMLRWASLAMMLLTIGKTFLDVLGLRDPLRVFSLLGLGLALLGLGLLYHKYVFRREPEEVTEV